VVTQSLKTDVSVVSRAREKSQFIVGREHPGFRAAALDLLEMIEAIRYPSYAMPARSQPRGELSRPMKANIRSVIGKGLARRHQDDV